VCRLTFSKLFIFFAKLLIILFAKLLDA